MKSMENLVEEAIVARFFEPSMSFQLQQTIDPSTGQIRSENMPVLLPAPMTTVAEAIYSQARTQIIQKVIERLDVDAIVAEWSSQIAKDVVAKLQEMPASWHSNPSKTEREKMMDKVYDNVAEEFGRQCVNHLRETGGLLGILES